MYRLVIKLFVFFSSVSAAIKKSAHKKNTYYINTMQYNRIWFSANPNQFITEENWVRQIQFDKQNPYASMFIVYASSLLNMNGIHDRDCFAYQFPRTVLVDFDKEFIAYLNTTRDKEIYTLAQEEIDSFRRNIGGNLAAASDMLRTVTAKYSNYIDFDVHFSTTGITQYLPVNQAVLLNIGSYSMPQENGKTQEVLNVNNDLIIVSRDQKTNLPIQQAINFLEIWQNSIIEAYKDPTKRIQQLSPGEPLREWRMGMANASHLSSVNVLRQHINNLINNQFFSAIKFTNWATFSNLLKKPEIRSYFNLSDNLVNKLHNVVYDHNQMDFPIDFSEEEINILKIFYIFTEATSLFTEASKALAEHEPNEKYMNSYTPLGQSNLKGLLAHHRSRKSLADEVITLLEKKNAGYLDAALKLITTTKDHRKKYISSVRDFSGPLNLVYTFSNLVKNEIEIQPTKELLKAFAENDGYEVHYYYNLPIAKDLIKTYSYFLERNLTRICSLKSNLGFNVDAVTFSRSMGLGGSSDGSWLPESKELARNRGIFFQYGQSRACPDNTSSLIKFR